jgi:hypothetical protein
MLLAIEMLLAMTICSLIYSMSGCINFGGKSFNRPL